MKTNRIQIAGRATLFFGCATAASAQGRVTLYGVLDDAIAYTNNQKGQPNIYLLQGSLTLSRFGLRGSEPLSGAWYSLSQSLMGRQCP
jgi:predicted porin